MSKEICLHKKIFDTTIRSTKTGNRTENRTPDQPEIFMDKLVCQYKFACIEIFSIRPTMFKQQQSAPTTIKQFYRSRKKIARSKTKHVSVSRFFSSTVIHLVFGIGLLLGSTNSAALQFNAFQPRPQLGPEKKCQMRSAAHWEYALRKQLFIFLRFR